MCRDEQNRTLLTVRTLCATQEGLEEHSTLGETTLKWTAIDNIVDTPTHTFLSVVGRGYSLVIPKNQVQVGHYAEFVKVCRSYQQGQAA